MTPHQAQRAAKIARARELRAQGRPLAQIVEIMTREGYKISAPSISQYTQDIDAPEHRGRKPIHTTDAARKEAQRASRLRYYHKNKERLNREAREARANESEAERAERRMVDRTKRRAREAQATDTERDAYRAKR